MNFTGNRRSGWTKAGTGSLAALLVAQSFFCLLSPALALSSHRVLVQPPPTYEFINKKGERAIPYLFHLARPFSEGLAPVLIGEEWGYIDREGTVKIGANFKLARDFHEGLAAVKIKNDWGYCDTTGKVVIKPRFESAGDFNAGLAVAYVRQGSKDFPKKVQEDANKILNTKDKEKEKAALGNNEALMAIVRSRRAGFIDRSGKFLIKPQYTYAAPFEDGLALVKEDDKYLYLDKEGKVKLSPSAKSAKSFSEGLAAIKEGEKWGFIDTLGKVVIKPSFDDVQSFYGELAAAKQGDEWGFIDKRGKWQIKPQFSSVWSGFKSGTAVCARDISPIKHSFGTVTKFNSGYVIARRSGESVDFDMATTPLSPGYFSYPDYRFGLIGKDGATVAPFQYGEIGDLSDGLRTVESDGGYGYIDNIGNIVIKPRYKATASFSDGLGMVKHGEVTSDKTRRAENLLKHTVPSKVRDPELIRKDIEVATEVIKLDPDNAQAYRDRGYLQCSLKEFRKSIKDFSEVIRICPVSTEGYYWRGHAYLQLKDYEKAAKDFTEAIKLNKADDSLFGARCQAFLGLGKDKNALIDVALALRLNNQPYYHGLLAGIFKKIGDERRWLFESWRARPSIDVNPWPTWTETEQDLLADLKAKEKALAEASRDKGSLGKEKRILALSELADSVDTLRRLKFRQEKVMELMPLLKRSYDLRKEAVELAGANSKIAPQIRLKNDLANSVAQLASWQAKSDEYESAEKYTAEALALSREIGSVMKEADYLNDSARLSIRQKKYSEAEKSLKESLKLSNDSRMTLMKIIRGQTHSTYAILLIKTDRDEEAQKMLEEANKELLIGTKLAFLPSPPLADAKTDARQYFQMGEQCRSMGLIEMSRQYMEEAAKKTTDKDLKARAESFVEVYLPQEKIDLADSKAYLTGRTAEVAGDFISAEKIYSALAAQNSKFFLPQVALARVYREYGDLSKAEKSAKKALSINKKSVEALIEMARINQERGRTGRGIAAIERALKIDPDNQMARFVKDSITSHKEGSDQEK